MRCGVLTGTLEKKRDKGNWRNLGLFFENKGFPGGLVGKESACSAGDAGDTGLISRLGSSPGGGRQSRLIARSRW